MPDPGPTDRGPADATSMTLLDRVRGDDQDAWSDVHRLYAPLVAYWCRRRGVPDHDVDDVIQDVLRAVAAGIGSFRRDRPGDTFRGWLRMVTSTKALDWHRRRSRQPDVAVGGTEAGESFRQLPEDLPGGGEDDDPRQLAALHRRALDLVKGEFEERTWRAFWRFAIEGHAAADVAADLGLSTASVRQAKSRVLRRLREALGDLIA